MNGVSMLVSRFASAGVIHWDFNVGQRPEPEKRLEQGAVLECARIGRDSLECNCFERGGFGWGI